MLFFKIPPITYTFLIKRAKRLQLGWNQNGGRNSAGRITSYKKGSFKSKRVYRFIDFWRRLASDAFIVNFAYDSFRTSTISLVFYQTGFLSYVVLPEGLKVGDKLKFNILANLTVSSLFLSSLGQALPLKYIGDGVQVFNIELWPLKGAQVCRAAGMYATIIGRFNNFVTLKLRSGWKIIVSDDCYATIGMSPNYKQIYRVLRKAGLRVNLGRRPTTRGVAMNAIDHPHGGGRGKTSGGPKPRTPWGFCTKKTKTVSRSVRERKKLTRFRA